MPSRVSTDPLLWNALLDAVPHRLQVFFAVVTGAFSLGQVGPNVAAFSTAQAAAARIFQVIDRDPEIDNTSDAGRKLKPEEVGGKIAFKNVSFAYPSRPDQQILTDFSLEVQAGETVAFVGESGSGKSTLIQLLQRFYDPLVRPSPSLDSDVPVALIFVASPSIAPCAVW